MSTGAELKENNGYTLPGLRCGNEPAERLLVLDNCILYHHQCNTNDTGLGGYGNGT